MPAKDKYHDVVIHALEKDGWTIEKENLRLAQGNRFIYLDLQARSETNQRIIFLEVKNFDNRPSFIAELEKVLGQYFLYRNVLRKLGIPHPLYLAVPDNAYDTVLQEELSAEVINEMNMLLLVFDPAKEEIVTWID